MVIELVNAEEQKDSQGSDSAKTGDDEEQRRKDQLEKPCGRNARGGG